MDLINKGGKANNLERLTWHECGHVIIDSLLVKEYENFGFNISSFEIDIKVGGKVVMNNFDPFLNSRITSYYLVNLTFGVILEAVFITKDRCSVEPAQLLKFNMSGGNDLEKIKKVKSEIKTKGLEDILNENMNSIYFKILNNFECHRSLKEIINTVIKVFENEKSKYILEKSHIDSFSKKILAEKKLDDLIEDIYKYIKKVEQTIA